MEFFPFFLHEIISKLVEVNFAVFFSLSLLLNDCNIFMVVNEFIIFTHKKKKDITTRETMRKKCDKKIQGIFAYHYRLTESLYKQIYILMKCETFRFYFGWWWRRRQRQRCRATYQKKTFIFGLNFLSRFFFFILSSKMLLSAISIITHVTSRQFIFLFMGPMHTRMRRLFLTSIQLLFTCWFSYQILSRFFCMLSLPTACLISSYFILIHTFCIPSHSQ